MSSDDLTALVFELQRTPSPKDKAKALARAWRTVRGLKPEERRLLARQVGFDGAEELIEGLGGAERGVFAPAAVLEVLGKIRTDPDFSVRRVLNDLRDPDRRDDLLVRGMDLVAESLAPSKGTAPEPESEIEIDRLDLPDGNTWMMEDDSRPDVDAEKVAAAFVPPPIPEPQHQLETHPMPQPETEPDQKPQPVPEPEPEQPSPWDTMETGEGIVDLAAAVAVPSLIETIPDARPRGSGEKVEGSAMERLRELREDLPDLERASVRALSERLDAFPEPWARRRALVALIESDVPDEATAALDLIETLDRPMDRSWCLSVLARRGDLAGDDLDRGLAMLSSPAARRRVARLV